MEIGPRRRGEVAPNRLAAPPVALQVETLDLTANHALLRTISEKSGGKYYAINQLDELKSDLLEEDPVSIIHTAESFQPLLHLKWLLILLLLLTSVEWFIRKYQGSY